MLSFLPKVVPNDAAMSVKTEPAAQRLCQEWRTHMEVRLAITPRSGTKRRRLAARRKASTRQAVHVRNTYVRRMRND